MSMGKRQNLHQKSIRWRLPVACLMLCLGSGCEVGGQEEEVPGDIVEEVELDDGDDVPYDSRRYRCDVSEHDGWRAYWYYATSQSSAIGRCQDRVNRAIIELCDIRWNQEYVGITMHLSLEGRYHILSDVSHWKCVDGDESSF